MSVSPTENRVPGSHRDEDTDVGIPIYPAGWKNESGDTSTSGGNYTASFNPQYYFTSSVNPAGAGTVSLQTAGITRERLSG